MGPDVMHAIFYKNNWNLLISICGMTHAFLKHGLLPHALDRTNITLIPEKDNLEKS